MSLDNPQTYTGRLLLAFLSTFKQDFFCRAAVDITYKPLGNCNWGCVVWRIARERMIKLLASGTASSPDWNAAQVPYKLSLEEPRKCQWSTVPSQRWRCVSLDDKPFPWQQRDASLQPPRSFPAARQALHCHWASPVNWMVHRLLNYFYILAFHARLKAYHRRDWDHRNLLHVWPFKAFHRDGSQVRIYWNQFLSEILMLAHQPCPVWSIHFIKREEKKLKKRERKREKKNHFLDWWKWAAFKSVPNAFVCLPPKLKRLWNQGLEEVLEYCA